MTVVHRITGYDKRSDRLTFHFDVPAEKLRFIKEIAGVERSDTMALGSYPLPPDQARRAARAINQIINVDRYSWYFEPFEEAEEVV